MCTLWWAQGFSRPQIWGAVWPHTDGLMKILNPRRVPLWCGHLQSLHLFCRSSESLWDFSSSWRQLFFLKDFCKEWSHKRCLLCSILLNLNTVFPSDPQGRSKGPACSHAGLSSQPCSQALCQKETFCPDKSAPALYPVLWKVNITQTRDYPFASQMSFLNSELVFTSWDLEPFLGWEGGLLSEGWRGRKAATKPQFIV